MDKWADKWGPTVEDSRTATRQWKETPKGTIDPEGRYHTVLERTLAKAGRQARLYRRPCLVVPTAYGLKLDWRQPVNAAHYRVDPDGTATLVEPIFEDDTKTASNARTAYMFGTFAGRASVGIRFFIRNQTRVSKRVLKVSGPLTLVAPGKNVYRADAVLTFVLPDPDSDMEWVFEGASIGGGGLAPISTFVDGLIRGSVLMRDIPSGLMPPHRTSPGDEWTR